LHSSSQAFIVLAYRYPPTLFVVVGMALVIGGGLVAIRGKSQAQPTAIES
jgi:hypothetical protein